MKKFRFWWFKHVSSWLVPEDWVRLGTTHNCQPPSAPERNFQVSHGFHPDGMKSPALEGLTMSLRDTTLERPVCPAFVGRFFPRYSQSLCFPYTYSHFPPLSDNTSKEVQFPAPRRRAHPSWFRCRGFLHHPAISHPSLGFSAHHWILFLSALNPWKGV